MSRVVSIALLVLALGMIAAVGIFDPVAINQQVCALMDWAPQKPVNARLVPQQEAAGRAGGVRAGDIVFLRFDWDQRAAQYPPYPETEALGWLADQGIKLLGIDSPGLEVQGDRRLPNHRLLFGRGIPLIESLVHLDQVRTSRVYVFAQPLPAMGTDAVPLRVLAFEGEE